MNNNDIWIAVISAASGILTALGLGKVVPSLIKWWEEKQEEKRKDKAIRYEQITKLNERINVLEKELDKHRAFETQTRSTLNAMLPLMKEMMKDHPNYVMLLEQLENNIIGKMVSADGKKA